LLIEKFVYFFILCSVFSLKLLCIESVRVWHSLKICQSLLNYWKYRFWMICNSFNNSKWLSSYFKHSFDFWLPTGGFWFLRSNFLIHQTKFMIHFWAFSPILYDHCYQKKENTQKSRLISPSTTLHKEHLPLTQPQSTAKKSSYLILNHSHTY
jgi:hypothetical protein